MAFKVKWLSVFIASQLLEFRVPMAQSRKLNFKPGSVHMGRTQTCVDFSQAVSTSAMGWIYECIKQLDWESDWEPLATCCASSWQISQVKCFFCYYFNRNLSLRWKQTNYKYIYTLWLLPHKKAAIWMRPIYIQLPRWDARAWVKNRIQEGGTHKTGVNHKKSMCY